MLKTAAQMVVCAVAVFAALISGAAAGAARNTAPAVFGDALKARLRFDGFIGERIRADEEQWLLTAPRDLLPWSGEFAGKYLTAAVLNWRITRSRDLKRVIDGVVADFVATQSPEGYLGPFPKESRLMVGWDLWGHYHALVGLLLYCDETGDEKALAAAMKAGDFVCEMFPQGGRRVVSAGDQEMNEAIIHGMLLLYQHTGRKRYLEMARRVEQDWEKPPSGDYVRTALAGMPFWQTPKPRWESLHDLQAIASFYWITGDEKYRRAFEHVWWSIVETDRHNTGGFSSGEQACGNPYNAGAIETCCTVAWTALSVDMLRMTGASVVADEIELATFNGGIGGQTPSGRWWTYNTPMEGEKKASAQDINFQCRPGSPELNCCSVNGPRILGMMSQWGLMSADVGLALNYYGPCELSAQLPSGERVALVEETDYPRNGGVTITMRLRRPQRFPLQLRIPHWSAKTSVAVNGKRVQAVAGTYLAIERAWKEGDKITLGLDMSPHFWVGERECEGKASVYRGPLLLAYDLRFNAGDQGEPPVLQASGMRMQAVPWEEWPQPWLLLKVMGANGAPVCLCDFASAGATGTRYHSWLRAEGAAAAGFSRQNPLRSSRASRAR